MEPLIIGTHGSVAALDPTSGQLRWQTALKTGTLLSSTRGEDVAVLVRGSIVFAGCFGHVFCLDAESGKILWQNPLSGLGHNDVSLAMNGVSVQFLQKVEQSGT